MGFRFQLAIYDAGFSRLVPVDEYLRLDAGGRWRPSLDDCGFFLECQDREWLAETWNMGNVALVVRQMEAAAERLEAGGEAIVRSGVLDHDEVPYLLFEPSGGETALVSLFFVSDPLLRHAFPHQSFTRDGERLYEHVRENREILLVPPANRFDTRFLRVPCPAAELAAALRREAELGRRLFDSLGVPLREGVA